MNHPSPVTPVAGVPRESLDMSGFLGGALSRTERSSASTPTSTSTPRDTAAAAALTGSALVLAADLVVRPLLAPDFLPHPVVQWTFAGALAAAGLGVRLGWRGARRIACGLGYVVGAGSFLALSGSSSFASGAEWWVAGVRAAESLLLGYVLHRLGWTGDEE